MRKTNFRDFANLFSDSVASCIRISMFDPLKILVSDRMTLRMHPAASFAVPKLKTCKRSPISINNENPISAEYSGGVVHGSEAKKVLFHEAIGLVFVKHISKSPSAPLVAPHAQQT